MSTPIITVENLGKKYRLDHKIRRQRYTALRDVIAENAKRLFRAPFARSKSLDSSGRTEEFWALKDVSFEVQQGEVIGIIGRNGAGKSTLLKVLSRITEPTAGRVRLRGRVASLLEVGTGFHPELTGRENIYLNGAILGMSRAEIRLKFDEIVAFAEVEKFLDTPVKRYSSGMYVRLAFGVAAHLEPEILIVDEVLAVGDQKFQEKCLGKMQDVASTGRTVLFVSHSMPSIQRLCRRVVALAGGSLVADDCTNVVIAQYIGGDLANSYVKPPNPARPTITKATLHVEESAFVLTVEFQSPFSLTPPVLGFVIYNSLGTPVFGTNTRADPLSPPPGPSATGRFEVMIPADSFRPDRYLVSLWLGDHYTDYCVNENILSVDLNENVGGGLPVRENGNVYLPTSWKYRPLLDSSPCARKSLS